MLKTGLGKGHRAEVAGLTRQVGGNVIGRLANGAYIVVAGRAARFDAGVIHGHGDGKARRGFVAPFARSDRGNVRWRFCDCDDSVMAIATYGRGLGVVDGGDVGPHRRLVTKFAAIRRRGMVNRFARSLRAIVAIGAEPWRCSEASGNVAGSAVHQLMTAYQRISGREMIKG